MTNKKCSLGMWVYLFLCICFVITFLGKLEELYTYCYRAGILLGLAIIIFEK